VEELRSSARGGRRRVIRAALVAVCALTLAACGATGPFPEEPQSGAQPQPHEVDEAGAPEAGAPDDADEPDAGNQAADAEEATNLAPEGPEANHGEAEVAAASEQRAEANAAALTDAGLEIPSIGVATPLITLGLNADRTMQVPEDFSLAGWYRHSPLPGDPGPAVIAGHVSGRSGPAVFYRLTELSAGDEIRVNYADGSTALFRVDRVEQHPKDAFPHDEVYGDTEDAQLRLITCGGEFDSGAGSHRDNVIVYASLAGG
jgi:LPXTG-site transpeptidase (sortase) family protein